MEEKDELKDLQDYVDNLVEEGYIDKSGYPLKCKHCGSTDLEHITVDRIDYTVCEKKVVCNRCKQLTGYWAYGYWEVL